MKISRFNNFKKITENISQPEIEQEVESSDEFKKLDGVKSNKVVMNGLNFNINDNVKFIFESGYAIFDISDITDTQIQLTTLDSTIPQLKVNEDYMIYIKDIMKTDDMKFYYDFASENFKWNKNLIISNIEDIDHV